MQVLIADDDRTTRRVIAKLLTDAGGFDLVEAEDGEQAASLIRQTPFDLLLLDWSMPKKPGIDIVRELRGRIADSDHHGHRRQPAGEGRGGAWRRRVGLRDQTVRAGLSAGQGRPHPGADPAGGGGKRGCGRVRGRQQAPFDRGPRADRATSRRSPRWRRASSRRPTTRRRRSRISRSCWPTTRQSPPASFAW